VNNRIRFETPPRNRPVPVEPVFPPDFEPGEYDPEDDLIYLYGPMEPFTEESEDRELEDWIRQ